MPAPGHSRDYGQSRSSLVEEPPHEARRWSVRDFLARLCLSVRFAPPPPLALPVDGLFRLQRALAVILPPKQRN